MTANDETGQQVFAAKLEAKFTILARINWKDTEGLQLTSPQDMLALAQAYKLLTEAG